MEESFSILGFQLYEATRANYTWLEKALLQIEYSLNAAKSYDKMPSDIAVVSIHGIETSGSWQSKLHKLINENYTDTRITHLQFKFEKFSLIRFVIPYFRNKMVKKFKEDLDIWIAKNETKRIVCFAHSFGTYILIKALETISQKSKLDNLDLIVLSGSVLKQNYDFRNLMSLKNVRLVNECAKQDLALLLSNSLVIGTGMGGRLGFNGLMSERFVNRGYQGGHSIFFENDCEIMKKYWIPLLEPTSNLDSFNLNGKDSITESFLEKLSRFISKIKIPLYISAPFFLIYFSFF